MKPPKNALAKTGTQLDELWAQRPDETEGEYWAFIEWMERGANRGPPAEAYRAAAMRFNWAERAAAFARAHNGTNPGLRTVNALALVLAIETEKLLKRAATGDDSTLSPKEIHAMTTMLTDLQRRAVQEKSAKTDLSGLTEDEMRTVLAAQKILARRGGGQ